MPRANWFIREQDLEGVGELLRALSRSLGAIAAATATCLALTIAVTAAPPSPLNPVTPSDLTFSAQTAHWSAAQFGSYRAKVAVRDAVARRLSAIAAGKATPYGCVPTPCIPNSKVMYLPTYQETYGVNGCTCGPAAARIALTAYGVYQSESNIAAAMGVDTNCKTSHGTSRSQERTGLNHYQSTDGYIWSNISYNSSQGPIDLMSDTSVNIGGYSYPLVYNGLTNSPPSNTGYPYYEGGHGAPLQPRWGTIRVWHYITGVGYNQSSNWIDVNDPAWGSLDSYGTWNVWAFIDNMAATDQVLW